MIGKVCGLVVGVFGATDDPGIMCLKVDEGRPQAYRLRHGEELNQIMLLIDRAKLPGDIMSKPYEFEVESVSLACKRVSPKDGKEYTNYRTANLILSCKPAAK